MSIEFRVLVGLVAALVAVLYWNMNNREKARLRNELRVLKSSAESKQAAATTQKAKEVAQSALERYYAARDKYLAIHGDDPDSDDEGTL